MSGRALRVGPGTVLRAATADGRAANRRRRPGRVAPAGRGGRRPGHHSPGRAGEGPPAGHARPSLRGRDQPGWALGRLRRRPPRRGLLRLGRRRGVRVRRLPSGGDYSAATFSPDGRTLVTSVRSQFSFWDVGSWELKASLPRAPRSLDRPGRLHTRWRTAGPGPGPQPYRALRRRHAAAPGHAGNAGGAGQPDRGQPESRRHPPGGDHGLQRHRLVGPAPAPTGAGGPGPRLGDAAVPALGRTTRNQRRP